MRPRIEAQSIDAQAKRHSWDKGGDESVRKNCEEGRMRGKRSHILPLLVVVELQPFSVILVFITSQTEY